MSSAWSWCLTASTVVGLWGTGGWRCSGWAVRLSGQRLWLAYALTTRQYGFVVSCAAFTYVFARDLRIALHEGAGSVARIACARPSHSHAHDLEWQRPIRAAVPERMR